VSGISVLGVLAVIGVSPFAVKLVGGARTTSPETPPVVLDIVGVSMQHQYRVAEIDRRLGSALSEAELAKC